MLGSLCRICTSGARTVGESSATRTRIMGASIPGLRVVRPSLNECVLGGERAEGDRGGDSFRILSSQCTGSLDDWKSGIGHSGLIPREDPALPEATWRQQ